MGMGKTRDGGFTPASREWKSGHHIEEEKQ
jgi:hypothetical protein